MSNIPAQVQVKVEAEVTIDTTPFYEAAAELIRIANELDAA